MDYTDAYILNVLQKNARTPNTEIAKQLDMAPSAILERIRKLEQKGVIKKYKAVINNDCLGLDLLAFVQIKSTSPNWTDACSEKLSSINQVEEVHELLGEHSYMIKLRVTSMDELSLILKDVIAKIDEVKETHTLMVTKTRKENAVNEITPTKKRRKSRKKNAN